MKLPEYLKNMRKSLNYTQEYVASYLNIQRQTYSAYETGQNIPPASKIKALSELYNVPVSFFMDALSESSQTTAASNELSTDEIVALFLEFCERRAEGLKYLSPYEKRVLFYISHLNIQGKEELLSYLDYKFRIKNSPPKFLL